MDLRTQFLEKLAENGQKLYPVNQWIGLMDLTNQSDIDRFFQVVRELEEEFEITTTRQDKIVLTKDAGWKTGVLSINAKGFGFVDLEEGSIYINATNLKDAMHQDTVLVKPKTYNDGSSEGTVVKVLKRAVLQVVIETSKVEGVLTYTINDPRIRQGVKFTESDLSHVTEGTIIVANIVDYGNPLIVKIAKVLGNKNDPGMDVLTVLAEYGIEPKFPQDVMDQVDKIPMEVLEQEKQGRRDYTNVTVCTIDGDDSKDFDDAISLTKVDDKYHLQVHIADVSHYVSAYSALDIEAERRTTSVYVVDRVVPMLPYALSTGICSLNPNVLRLTLTCDMVVKQDGSVESYEIVPSFIRSDYRMTYNNVNKILHGDPEMTAKYAEVKDWFFLMRECALRIRSRREGLGSINFETIESKFKVDEKGKVIAISARKQDEAELIIEDFMVLANETVARHMKWLEIPALYRVHETPAKLKMQEFSKLLNQFGEKLRGDLSQIQPGALQKLLTKFENKPEFHVISTVLLRSMQKAKYDPKCIGHFGLALKEYLHFTSPIRRYPDLIVHRMLRKYHFNIPDEKGRKDDEHLMETYALETSFGERNAVEAEREVENMKKAEFMVDHVGEVHNGIISGVTRFGFFVSLENTVEGLVHIQNLTDDYYEFDPRGYSLRGSRTHRTFVLGQKIKIKVTGANKEKKTVDFQLAEEVKHKSTPPTHKGGPLHGRKNRIR
ncbi:MAG: ribonuclease R [Erysipelotrichaceae bacterium]